MKLKVGKEYYVRLKKDHLDLEFYMLIKIRQQINNKTIKVIYKKNGNFEIIDKRFKHMFPPGNGFLKSRFIIDEQLQLELEF